MTGPSYKFIGKKIINILRSYNFLIWIYVEISLTLPMLVANLDPNCLTLWVLLKDRLEKVNFEKVSRQQKHDKLPSMQRFIKDTCPAWQKTLAIMEKLLNLHWIFLKLAHAALRHTYLGCDEWTFQAMLIRLSWDVAFWDISSGAKMSVKVHKKKRLIEAEKRNKNIFLKKPYQIYLGNVNYVQIIFNSPKTCIWNPVQNINKSA